MPATSQEGARFGLGLGLLAYAVYLFIHIGAVAGGSDNSGYFNEARLMAHGSLHAPVRSLPGLGRPDSPYLYSPLGFRPSPDGTAAIVPTYPPGLSLMIVAASWVAGWAHAGDLVLLLHSLAGLALVFSLGRACGLSPQWSLAAVAVVAVSPLYLYLSLQALSDVPAMVWATAAVVAALRSRDRPAFGLWSGLCISVAFLVRPNNALVFVPVAIAAWGSPRALVLACAGALPGVAAWLAINNAAYGNPLESGYGAIGAEFHRSLVVGTLGYYGRWLPFLLSPVVILAPLVLAQVRRVPRVALTLAAWAAAYLAFFVAYRWTAEQWWFLRFLLPAAPALVIAGFLVVQGWRSSWPRWAPVAVAACLVCVEATQARLYAEARQIGHGELKYARIGSWLRSHAPQGSVVLASQTSGALFYYTDFVLLRFDELTPPALEKASAAADAAHRPFYAVLFPFEDHFLNSAPSRWKRVVSVDDVGIWIRGPGRPANP
jgi:hypothetical protein